MLSLCPFLKLDFLDHIWRTECLGHGCGCWELPLGVPTAPWQAFYPWIFTCNCGSQTYPPKSMSTSAPKHHIKIQRVICGQHPRLNSAFQVLSSKRTATLNLHACRFSSAWDRECFYCERQFATTLVRNAWMRCRLCIATLHSR